LILACLEIRYNLLGDFSQITAPDEVVRFEEDGSQTRFSDRVVLQIELVEAMKRIRVSLLLLEMHLKCSVIVIAYVHIECIDTQVVRR
jgi:hypothetical protein